VPASGGKIAPPTVRYATHACVALQVAPLQSWLAPPPDPAAPPDPVAPAAPSPVTHQIDEQQICSEWQDA
jgi:hypothetical protein